MLLEMQTRTEGLRELQERSSLCCQCGVITPLKLLNLFTHTKEVFQVPELSLRQDVAAKLSCLKGTRAVHLHWCGLIQLLVKRTENCNNKFHPFL